MQNRHLPQRSSLQMLSRQHPFAVGPAIGKLLLLVLSSNAYKVASLRSRNVAIVGLEFKWRHVWARLEAAGHQAAARAAAPFQLLNFVNGSDVVPR